MRSLTYIRIFGVNFRFLVKLDVRHAGGGAIDPESSANALSVVSGKSSKLITSSFIVI